MTPFTRILVPTDFSAASDAALGYAQGLADSLGAKLTLLHVVESTVAPAALAPEALLGGTPGLVGMARDDAAKRLEGLLPVSDRIRFRVTIATSVGFVSTEILQYARDHDIDLIVMGTHGRAGLAHLLLGSVTEQIVRSAPCPVLTVRTRAVPQPRVEGARELTAPPALA